MIKLKAKGAETAYSENVPPADHIETMKDYARRGFNPVIGHSGRFLSAAQRVGPGIREDHLHCRLRRGRHGQERHLGRL